MGWRTAFPRLGRLAHFAFAALISASVLSLASSSAEARHYGHYHHKGHSRYAHFGRHAHHSAWRTRSYGSAVPISPAFSAMVVDANSGRTLYSVAEDAPRHPASITKVMTLYLLFERLDKGGMTLQTRIPISEHAAAQEPSKLGLDPGETISVEDAIKAVVTRSANDIAVAIAEGLGGTESAFAEVMTRKAQSLGMAHTVYRNASGLPNDEQITTARDLTILARSLEERFPRYFKYFATHDFEYAGQIIGNHNHLLGRVDGVDGIKTGYTRASGFNLLTSVHRDGRSLIAVVMGGRTSRARDRIMESLIEDHVAEASTVHTATMIADASKEESSRPPRPESRPRLTVVAARVPARAPTARSGENVAQGDDSEENDANTLRVAAVARVVTSHPAERRPSEPRVAEERAAAPSVEETASIAPTPTREQTPAQLRWVKGPDPTRKLPDATSAEAPTPPVKPKPEAAARAAVEISESTPPKGADAEDEDRRSSGKGWIIQIGATDDIAKANALLARARERNRTALADAKPFTEKVRKGEDVLYRARFAGLDSASAESACRSLKRNGFACFASRD